MATTKAQDCPSGPQCQRYHRRESMMTTSNGNIFRVTSPLCGGFTGHRWFPHKRPVMPTLMWVRKSSNDRWFGTTWRSCDVIVMPQGIANTTTTQSGKTHSSWYFVEYTVHWWTGIEEVRGVYTTQTGVEWTPLLTPSATLYWHWTHVVIQWSH